MQNNSRHGAPPDADTDTQPHGPYAKVELIRIGSPEHAALLAEEKRQSDLRRARRQKRAALAAQPPSPERHERKCAVCNHADRDEIEELFVHWHDPFATALHYGIPVRSIWRHAHATNLYKARQGNLRSVLDRILERNWRIKVTGDTINRAVRAYAALTDDNKWVEPVSRVVVSTEPPPAANPALPPAPASSARALTQGSEHTPAQGVQLRSFPEASGQAGQMEQTEQTEPANALIDLVQIRK